MPSPDSPPALTVRVAASTSNLGPGFDFLGLALSLWLDASLRSDSPLACENAAIGDAERDLVRIAYERGCAAAGVRAVGTLTVESEIPIGRGFGSSGAAVAAGLLLASARAPALLELDDLLALGLALEGHPDNVTASLVGGCTLCHPCPEEPPSPPLLVRQAVHPSIGFVLAWPDRPLPTERAREVLPDVVPFADAVDNPRRLALLLEGLRTGQSRLLRLGGIDRLHERHRLALLPGAEEACARAREAGAWLATLSGAGSGIVALGPLDAREAIATSLRDTLRAAGVGGQARCVQPVLAPPIVRRLSSR